MQRRFFSGITPQKYKMQVQKHLHQTCISSVNLFLMSCSSAELTSASIQLQNSISKTIFTNCLKKQPPSQTLQNNNLKKFNDSHNSTNFDNLNVVSLLKCPKYGSSLKIDKSRTKAIAEEAGIYYPIINDIPILVSSEANRL